MGKTRNRMTVFILIAVTVLVYFAGTAVLEGQHYMQPVLQREETVMIEGMPETFPSVLFRREGIFALWYDARNFVPAVTSMGIRFDLISNTFSSPLFFGIEDTWDPDSYDEPALSDAQEEYEHNGWVCAELNTDGIMQRFHFEEDPVQGFIARKDGQTAQVYLASVTSGNYLCTLRYPQEAAEGWGARMMHMLNTLEALPGE